jgi:hypothetical protein
MCTFYASASAFASFESIVWGLTLAEGEPRKHDSTLVLA